MTISESRDVVADRTSEDEAEAPIRERHRGTRGRRTRVGGVAVAMAGVVAGIVLLLGSGQAARSSTPAGRSAVVLDAPSSPSTFVLATSHGLDVRLGLYSARTGGLLRRLASFRSASWNNNALAFGTDGMALTRNGRALYFSAIHEIAGKRIAYRSRHHLRPFRSARMLLLRLNTADGRYSFVADGAQPALNRSSNELAYAAFPRGLAVRDLRTGQTRTIALGQLDTSAELIGGTVAWLGDGTHIAVMPAPTAWDLMGKQPNYQWCGTSQRHSVIVFVHVPPAPAPLTSTCVRTPGPDGGPGTVLAADPRSPTSVLVASGSVHGATVVRQLANDGASRTVTTIASAWQPIAFDANANHLLFLTDTGHGPPTIAEAKLGSGRHNIVSAWRDRHIPFIAGTW